MSYYVYIIQSQSDGTFYKGFSENPLSRLLHHNNKESKYTSHKTPWQLVAVLQYDTKKEALIKERKIKICLRLVLQFRFLIFPL